MVDAAVVSRLVSSDGDSGAKSGTHSVKLPSNRFLYYIDEETIRKNVKERGYAENPSVKQLAHSDLVDGIYEGYFLYKPLAEFPFYVFFAAMQ
ncbi:unnamed protein product [Gongylonema pulchrum]|uniref:BAH domain-containing protein n=1 Tax=Gongylonema pulchrum TaxID=637853 RepID=A0A183D7A7_9BILA|nr:unnamed protein product [Gongylonema pulchrum]